MATTYEQWKGHPSSEASLEELKQVFYETEILGPAEHAIVMEAMVELQNRNFDFRVDN